MYLYNKEMFDKFKFKFDGLENIQKSYSQCLQEMFVLAVLNGKREGIFLEVGAYQPQFISNTFLLESGFGWKGISIDIERMTESMFNRSSRTCTFILSDALKVDYAKVLHENGMKERVDYLSLDIEPSINTFECLKLMPFDEFRFSVITYETDYYDPATEDSVSEMVRTESRKMLTENGYILINGNVSNLDNEHPFEDWYIDGDLFDDKVIERFQRKEDSPLAAHLYMLEE
jgi:hypothetical protein